MPMIARREFLVLPLLAILFCSLPARAEQPAIQEHEVKAAFLYNFARFVTWEDSAFETNDSPIIIGIVGETPLTAVLEQAAKNHTVKARVLQVRRIGSAEELANPAALRECHLLFIEAKQRNVETILRSLKGSHVLTVGETPGFAAEGGMIEFFRDRNRIRFRINVDATRQAHLRLSSKLLALAEITGSE